MKPFILLSFMMLCLCVSSGYSQRMLPLWEYALERIERDAFQVSFSDAKEKFVLSPKAITKIVSSLKEAKVLDNPDTRSLPELDGMLVLFLRDCDLVVIQVAKNHWFKAVYFEQGQIHSVILRDYENKFYQQVQQSLQKVKQGEKKEDGKEGEAKEKKRKMEEF